MKTISSLVVVVALLTPRGGLLAQPAATRPSDTPTAGPVTVEDLVRRGKATAQLIADGKSNLSWTTRLSMQGVTIDATNVLAGAKSKRTLQLLLDGGKHAEIVSIIEVDHTCYVREEGNAVGKYRPFEAPVGFPSAYILLRAGDLTLLPDSADAKILSVANGVATVGLGTGAQARAQTQNNIDAMREMLGKLGDRPEAEKIKQKIAELQKALTDGESVSVDLKTGVVLTGATTSISREVTSLSTKTSAAPKNFDVGTERWKDLTGDPTLTKNPDDLIMIANSPNATVSNAQQAKSALDLCLVNLSSKQVRRVPFYGAVLPFGCFSHDRKKVYVSAMAMEGSTFPLFEINLSTGENCQIGGDPLPSGMAIGPALSPDETRLAVAIFSPNLKSQICLVDIKTGKASKLGTPFDTSMPSWLDDGKGLIMASREYPSMDQPAVSSVARMDLDGKLTVLAKGENPLVIPGRNKILLEQEDEWKTCDLDGKNLEPYAGGMKGYGFPGVSANGKRIVWMHFQTGQLPQPVVQGFGNAEVKNLDLGPGLWASPAWR